MSTTTGERVPEVRTWRTGHPYTRVYLWGVITGGVLVTAVVKAFGG